MLPLGLIITIHTLSTVGDIFPAPRAEVPPVSYFLAKTDPESYAIEDLARDGTTTWDGVRNAQALAAIRSMRPGDPLLIYHSMGKAAIVGLAEVTSVPRVDPEDGKLWVVDVRYVGTFAEPVTLAEIKGTSQFDDWALVRQSRLSTMAVPEGFVAWLRHKGVL